MKGRLWKANYNFTIFGFTIFIFWVVALLFYEKIIAAGYLVGAIVLVSLFFFSLHFFEKRWAELHEAAFNRRLLWTSLAIRLVAMLGLYYFYQHQTGQPFEFYAVDSIFYHEKGLFIADNFRHGNFDIARMTNDLEFSDKGYNIYLGTVYYLTSPSILIPRLLNVVYSAMTVVLIHRIASQFLAVKTARLAGILAMLFPNFLLYLGTHLKEPLMILLVVFVLYQSIRVVKLGKRQVGNLILLISAMALLFTFRTVLAFVLFASFLSYAIFLNASSNKPFNIMAGIFCLAIFSYLILTSDIGNEIAAYYEKRTSGLADNMQFRAAREGGNRFALIASAPLFLSVILMAPFPSFVYVFQQENLWMFLGANFIKNLLAFFAIAGIIYSIRHHFRERSLLIVFLLGYLGVLANSGFAISERFHLPVLPVLIIFTAAGIESIANLKRNYYWAYLGLTAVLIIGWNFIKLAGRA
jgi:hypothetical protein